MRWLKRLKKIADFEKRANFDVGVCFFDDIGSSIRACFFLSISTVIDGFYQKTVDCACFIPGSPLSRAVCRHLEYYIQVCNHSKANKHNTGEYLVN